MLIKRLENEEEIKGKAIVHCQAWQEAYAGLIDPAFLAGRSVETSEKYARQALAQGYPTFVAKDGDRVIGFVDYGPCRNDDLPGAGEVYALYILKAYYDQSIGYALMQRALAELKDYEQVVVWVLEGNERAIRFYEKCGFRRDGKEQELMLGTKVKEVRMVRGLN